MVGIVLPSFDVYPFDVLLTLVLAGLLIPIWEIWVANRRRGFGTRRRKIWLPTDLAEQPDAWVSVKLT